MKSRFLFLAFLLPTLILAQNADINLLRNINGGRNTALDPVFRSLSRTDAVLCIGVPVLLAGKACLTHDSIGWRKTLVIGASGAATAVLVTGLKYSINRQRPFEKYTGLEKLDDGGSPSFPSGHTSSAFSLATSLSLAWPKWYIIVPSYAWAGSVGYSRMHLGVHYPTDVLAGALIGGGTAWLCWKLNRTIFPGNN